MRDDIPKTMSIRYPVILILTLALYGCSPSSETPLDATRAEEIIRSRMFASEPAYAEVPMQVRWGPGYEKDEFDERSLETLQKLESAGLVTTESSTEGDMNVVTATTTPEGFRELGTVPSARGPALRGRIAEKVVDGIANFERHPTEPLVGRAEVLWHYENPTPLYELFDTKEDKPLDTPFRSVVSLSYGDRGWLVETVVPKLRAEE